MTDRPAVTPDAPDTLRDEVAAWLYRRVMQRDRNAHAPAWRDAPQSGWLGWADDLLRDVPALAVVRDETTTTHARIEALLTQWDHEDGWSLNYAGQLRAALAGDAT